MLDADRRFVCDVSPLQGATIEEDLGQRDFTVNAMAVPLAGGPLIDPHGGERDLREGLLRVVGPRAYEDDPLRPLRLVRFAAELGFRADAETERLTPAAAPRLSEPSPERVFAELRRLVMAHGCLAGLDLAERLAVLGAVLPELTALEGIEQSRFHHLDVYDHTIEVLRQLIELEADLPSVFGDLAGPLRSSSTSRWPTSCHVDRHCDWRPCFTTWPSRPPAACAPTARSPSSATTPRARTWWARSSAGCAPASGCVPTSASSPASTWCSASWSTTGRCPGVRSTPTCAAPSPWRSRSRCCPAPTAWPPAARARSPGSPPTWSWRES